MTKYVNSFQRHLKYGITVSSILLLVNLVPIDQPDFARPIQDAIAPTVHAYSFGLIPLILACAAPQRFKNCDIDEIEYLKKALNWIYDHPDQIEDEAQALGATTETDVEKITDKLRDATISCESDLEESRGESRRFLTPNVIAIDTADWLFILGLEDFWAGQELDSSSIQGIVQLDNSSSEDVISQYQQYLLSIVFLVEVLTHEATHLALKKDHTRKMKKEIDRIVLAYGDLMDPRFLLDQLLQFDEIYEWGASAGYALLDWFDKINAEIEEELSKNN